MVSLCWVSRTFQLAFGKRKKIFKIQIPSEPSIGQYFCASSVVWQTVAGPGKGPVRGSVGLPTPAPRAQNAPTEDPLPKFQPHPPKLKPPRRFCLQPFRLLLTPAHCYQPARLVQQIRQSEPRLRLSSKRRKLYPHLSPPPLCSTRDPLLSTS